MNTTILTTSSALILLLATTTTACATDSYNDGWIAHVNDHQLEICYKATPPAVGQTVQILHTSFITPNKGPVREQFTSGGTARIITAATSGCLTAELIEGSAKRSDHARSDAAAAPAFRS